MEKKQGKLKRKQYVEIEISWVGAMKFDWKVLNFSDFFILLSLEAITFFNGIKCKYSFKQSVEYA